MAKAGFRLSALRSSSAIKVSTRATTIRFSKLVSVMISPRSTASLTKGETQELVAGSVPAWGASMIPIAALYLINMVALGTTSGGSPPLLAARHF
jgi:hypothetical protein